jgi:hypothetical protein
MAFSPQHLLLAIVQFPKSKEKPLVSCKKKRNKEKNLFRAQTTIDVVWAHFPVACCVHIVIWCGGRHKDGGGGSNEGGREGGKAAALMVVVA